MLGTLHKKPRFDILITLGISLVLVDRVDFLAGAGPFALTPFLALAPFVLTATMLHVLTTRSEDRGAVSLRGKRGAMWLSVVVLAVLTSLFFGPPGHGLARSALLVVQMSAGVSLVALIRWSENWRAVRRGAYIGLAIYAIFDLYQWVLVRARIGLGEHWSGVVNGTLSPLGADAFRFTGACTDPNRAVPAIAFFTYLLLADPVTSRPYRRWTQYGILSVGLVMSALTLSRSGLIVFFIILAAAIGTMVRQMPQAERVLWFVLGGFTLVWFARGTWIDELGARSIIDTRLSRQDGSARSHLELLHRGWDGSTIDWHFLTGHGYGQSYLYLQDIFPQDIYANYHSLFITMLFETGVVGLIAVVALTVGPLRSRRRWLALGVIAFNLFYQDIADPLFWVQIALLWFVSDTPLEAPPDRGGSASMRARKIAPFFGPRLPHKDLISTMRA
ncbi:O-antigen ligase family protein [Nocardioides sp. BP30]|uniref:O-antigen ligase family protein n=1 Tax=Nocardioides sp. BP30 TaxID=3036374 RepID=UPI002469B6FA|nr:O-antigen ligase family protein [Nocardioides sp. BP30]WGL52049.1 O-antigen ligase family protein [Nocardioides sp. BP30]